MGSPLATNLSQAFCCWPKGSLGGLVIGGRVWDKGVAALAWSKKVISKASFAVSSHWEGKATIETQSPQFLIPGECTDFPKGIPRAAAGTPSTSLCVAGDSPPQTPLCESALGIFSPQVLCLEAAAFCPRTRDHSTQLIQPLEKDFVQQKLNKKAHMDPGQAHCALIQHPLWQPNTFHASRVINSEINYFWELLSFG